MTLRAAPVNKLPLPVLADGHRRTVIAYPAPVDQGAKPPGRITRGCLPRGVREQGDKCQADIIGQYFREGVPLHDLSTVNRVAGRPGMGEYLPDRPGIPAPMPDWLAIAPHDPAVCHGDGGNASCGEITKQVR